jgi:iron complex outermembrane receptor protein
MLAGSRVSAQAGTDTVGLPPVTVTATRTATSILTTPLAVSKIAAPELRAVGGFGLDEALSRVPGVLAQSRFGTSDVRLVIRGFGARGAGDRSNAGTSRGVRVLIDGFPETEPDGRTSFDQIDLASTEAIEVVRSNASSVWGNAAGGVVNLLTVPDVNSFSLDLQPVYGSFGLARYAGRVATPLGAGTAYGNYTNTHFDGWRDHSSARRFLANGGVVGSVGANNRVGLYASWANNLFHIPGPLTKAEVDANPRQANATYASRNERRYNRIGRVGATVEHDFSERTSLSSMVFVSPKYLQRSERNTFRDFTRYHVGGNLIARTDAMFGSVRNRITIGGDEAYQDGAILFYSLDGGNRGTQLRDNKGEGANTLGLFVQDELAINPRLTLLLGARYDNVSYYNHSFINPALNGSKAFEGVTPKAGATWMLTDRRSVYVNVGGGIEVPAGNEVDPFAAQGEVSINPLLNPIRSTTVEFGTKSYPMQIGTLWVGYDLALYNTDVRNDLQPYNQGRFYMSAGKTRRSGAELGLSAFTEGGQFGSAALTFSRNRYIDYSVDSSLFMPGAGVGVFDGNKAVGVPDIMAHFEIGTEIPGFRALRAKAGIEHVGQYFADDANAVDVPAYTLVSATLELRRPVLAVNGWGLRGFVTVHNLANRNYIGSAFLNPDYVNGVPVAYEPGMPRTVTVSFSVGRLP